MKYKFIVFLFVSAFIVYVIISFDKDSTKPFDENMYHSGPAFKKEELPSQWKSKQRVGDLRISVHANKKGDTAYVVQRYTLKDNGSVERKAWVSIRDFPSADKAMRYLRDMHKQEGRDSSVFNDVDIIPFRISI